MRGLVSGFLGICSRLSSIGSRKRNRPGGWWEGWAGFGPTPTNLGAEGVCVCVYRCCFSMARVLGSCGAGRRPSRGQEGPAAAHQILSFVALKSRRPWCRKSPGLWKDLGPWSGPAQGGAGPWEEKQGELQGAESTTAPPPALSPCPLAPALFEMGQEVGNGVVGPINAQALAEAQQAVTGLGWAGPSTGHTAVGLLVFARHQGLLQQIEAQQALVVKSLQGLRAGGGTQCLQVLGHQAHDTHQVAPGAGVGWQGRSQATGHHSCSQQQVHTIKLQDPVSQVEAAHAGVDLNEPRPSPGQLELHVEDPVQQPAAQATAEGGLHQLRLLLRGQPSGHAGCGLSEARQPRGAIVRDEGSQQPPAEQHQIHIMFRALDELHQQHSIAPAQPNARVVSLALQVSGDPGKVLAALRGILHQPHTHRAGPKLQLHDAW